MKIRFLFISFFLTFIFLVVDSKTSLAAPGDTTVVQTFDFGPSPYNAKFLFPSDTVRFEKILMYYTLKCVPGNYPACGEWDYLTYTRLYEHTGVLDSVLQYHPNFVVGGSTPDSLMYNNNPSWEYIPAFELFNQTTFTDTALIGSGSVLSNIPFASPDGDSRTQFFWEASELTSAGLFAGEITGMRLNFQSTGGELSKLMIRIKRTNLDSITAGDIQNSGFTEVYYRNTMFYNTGWNTIPFTFPFLWDGISNIIIDISYQDNNSATPYVLMADDVNYKACISSSERDYFLNFNGPDFVDVPASVFSNLSDAVTVSFWQYGDPDIQPQNNMTFHGSDVNDDRQLNSHLPWSNGNIYWDAGNDGSGYDRIFKTADSAGMYRGHWNHWAFTKDATTGIMKMYYNGNQWFSGTGLTKSMAGIIDFKIGANTPNTVNNYDGMIDEFRVWNKSLDINTINDWMYKKLDNTHPDYANLLLEYSFNDGFGTSTTDDSPNNNTAYLFGIPEWMNYKGINRFKGFTGSNIRPQVVFEQGFYNPATLDSVLVIDSIQKPQLEVIFFADTNNPTTPTDTIYPWPAYYTYVFDANGVAIDSTLVTPDSIVNKIEMPYYDPPFEIVNRWEIGRFITPYGYGLDLGSGFTWVYDVTDYRTLLYDSVHLSAGNWQELLDMKFIMIEGTPPRDVVKIENMWNGNYSLNNIDITVPPIIVDLDSAASSFKLKTCTSGHQFSNSTNCAEFCPKIHSINVDGIAKYSWQIIEECASNPLYPQGGTWIYDRAGWCPGAKVTVQNFEITPFITGNQVELDYNSQTDPYGNYILESQLISYTDNNFTNDAAVVEILSPNNKKFYGRINPTCGQPKVRIKNTGKAMLTNLQIHYGVSGANIQSYDWAGNLPFDKTEIVTLDPINWTGWQGDKQFTVTISDPNYLPDEYTLNNNMTSEFEIVPDYNNVIVLILKTNHAAYQTSWTLKDAHGNLVYSNGAMPSNNTIYYDTLSLQQGCYTLQILDSGGDGLEFWANMPPYGNGTKGFVYLRDVTGPLLTNLEPDFGNEISWSFTVDMTTSIKEESDINYFEVYPNPATDNFNVSFILDEQQDVKIELYDLLGKCVYSNVIKSTKESTITINSGNLQQGMYYISLKTNQGIKTKRITITN